MPRDNPPEEMSVEEYLKLTEANPKKKTKVKKERRTNDDPPMFCAVCKKRVTQSQSSHHIVEDGKTTFYHWECYPWKVKPNVKKH